jgi:hypothetical protein
MIVDRSLETHGGEIQASGRGQDLLLSAGSDESGLAGRAERQVVLYGLLLIAFEQVVEVIQ